MSRTPAPVALTAALLSLRAASRWEVPVERDPYGDARPTGEGFALYAALASRLHRLAQGARRANVAEANGELSPGERDKAKQWGESCGFDGRSIRDAALRRIKQSVESYATRIDRQIAKISQELEPLAIHVERNTDDPRGFPILLRSTDPTRPLPSNELGGAWGIA